MPTAVHTASGFEKRIREAAPDFSKSKVQRLAIKMAKRAANMQEEFDFYTCLRILGMSSDTTARDAILPKPVPSKWIGQARTGDIVAEGMVQA